MSDDHEHGAEAPVRDEVEPDRGGVGERHVLNPAHEGDIARMAQGVDVVVAHDEVQPKGVRGAHVLEPTTKFDHAHGTCFRRMEEMALPVTLEQLIGKERLSLIREMTLVHRDLAPVVPEARPGDTVVVLVHGFCATRGRLPPARARASSARPARASRRSPTPRASAYGASRGA